MPMLGPGEHFTAGSFTTEVWALPEGSPISNTSQTFPILPPSDHVRHDIHTLRTIAVTALATIPRNIIVSARLEVFAVPGYCDEQRLRVDSEFLDRKSSGMFISLNLLSPAQVIGTYFTASERLLSVWFHAEGRFSKNREYSFDHKPALGKEVFWGRLTAFYFNPVHTDRNPYSPSLVLNWFPSVRFHMTTEFICWSDSDDIMESDEEESIREDSTDDDSETEVNSDLGYREVSEPL